MTNRETGCYFAYRCMRVYNAHGLGGCQCVRDLSGLNRAWVLPYLSATNELYPFSFVFAARRLWCVQFYSIVCLYFSLLLSLIGALITIPHIIHNSCRTGSFGPISYTTFSESRSFICAVSPHTFLSIATLNAKVPVKHRVST